MSGESTLPIIPACDGCGACCRHMIVPPFVLSGGSNEALEKGVPQSEIDELLPTWQLRLELPESPCLWYDAATARCRHYDWRPEACRAFEINSGSCHASRTKWGVADAASLESGIHTVATSTAASGP